MMGGHSEPAAAASPANTPVGPTPFGQCRPHPKAVVAKAGVKRHVVHQTHKPAVATGVGIASAPKKVHHKPRAVLAKKAAPADPYCD